MCIICMDGSGDRGIDELNTSTHIVYRFRYTHIYIYI